MKALFTSLPDDLMVPEFRARCQEITASINHFLLSTGQDPDKYSNLAAFMKKVDLPEAYIEQGAELGWPTFDLNCFVEDEHLAAVEAFLQDGGRASDFMRIFHSDIDTLPVIDRLGSGGVRELFRSMGLVHGARTVEFTEVFAKRVYQAWSKAKIRKHFYDQSNENGHLTMAALGAVFGSRPYRGFFTAEQFAAVTSVSTPLFEVENKDALEVLKTSGVDRGTLARLTEELTLQHEIDELARRSVVVDMDDTGIVARMNAAVVAMVPLVEIPGRQAVASQRTPTDTWNDLWSRMKGLLRYLVSQDSLEFLAKIMTHSVIVETERFWGLRFADQGLLEEKRLEATRQWKRLSSGDRHGCIAMLAVLERQQCIPISRFESSPTGFAALSRACQAANPREQHTELSRHWRNGIPQELWPLVIEQAPFIDQKTPALLRGAYFAACVWAQKAEIPRRWSLGKQPLYGSEYLPLKAGVQKLRGLTECDEVKIHTLQMLHENNLLDAAAIEFLRWGGDVLERLNFAVSDGVRTAMLELDLGL
ncbi:hypothetical protein RBE51_21370 [Pseudomonas taiwanensis]|uniref:hypothetical protein n=1 Tax=Pseudomonas taiwanensis TaxID=470150 RepID=UPI0028DF0C41|nr:hypothetical protein [Pseudomonas taiwanensis]MDT8925349.1 hypothetical protein [Pseudomonas taiwanensis]